MRKREKVLITGAGGFIGHHLTKYLKKKGYWVRGVDIKNPEFEKTSADEFLLLDLRKRENADIVTRGVTHVYNLASNMGGVGFIDTVRAELMRDNILIDVNMIDAAYKSGVEKFFYPSSALVYPNFDGSIKNAGLKEEYIYPAKPDSEYEWEKLFAERLCLSYYSDYGLQTRVARLHNIYGPLGVYDGGREKSPRRFMKILYLLSGISSPAGWGTEYIQNLIVAFSGKGVSATIISPILLYTNKDWKEWTKKQFDAYGVRIVTINTPNWLKRNFFLHLVISNVLSTFMVIKLLRMGDYDLIHEFSSVPPLVLFRSLIFKLIFNKPTLFTLSVYNNSFLGSFRWFKLFNFAKYYIIPSKEIISILLKIGIPVDKVLHIPPGLNLDLFIKKRDLLQEREKLSLSKDKFILAYYGTLTKEKGVIDLLDAYLSLEEKIKSRILLLLCVVWRGSSEHKEIKDYILSKKDKNIKLLESYVDIPGLIWASDAIILPQQTGFGTTIPPISVIEALAAGKTLIATDIIGNREIVTDELGVLMPPKNPTKLANAIRKVYRKRDVKKTNGEHVKVISKFQLKTVAREYISLYERTIKGI